MKIVFIIAVLTLVAAVLPASAQDATSAIKDIKARFENGQVFITWKESAVPDGTTFNVYACDKQITNETLKDAKKLAHHIEPHSARNWWRDPASFSSEVKSASPIGFVIKAGELPLNPSDGLFVHTPDKEDVNLTCYAVTLTGADGKEYAAITPGVNSLSSAVRQSVQPVEAIWQGAASEPLNGGSRQDALLISLHSRGGGAKFTDDGLYLVFGLPKHGWREGLPFVFKVSKSPGKLTISPSGCFFAGRRMTDSWDKRDHVPAIEKFWYGYNEFIYDQSKMKDGRIFNYSEEILLWLKEWAVRKFSINPNMVYLQGTSMGGCGSVSNAIHQPSGYAAVCAMVPIVSYTNLKNGSAHRLESFCGNNFDIMCAEGIPLSERMNGEIAVKKSTETLPFMFILNGRQDASIPWENNPGFYKALDESRQGYTVYWNNGKHDTAIVDVPEDVKKWNNGGWLSKFSLDQSFPAFSNCSANKNPGNGGKANGDIAGWMNRGMSWEGIEDEQSHYAITVMAFYPGIQYPVTVDVTPRRLQRFKPSPGENLSVLLPGGVSQNIIVDKQGLFTVKGISIPSEKGLRLIISSVKK